MFTEKKQKISNIISIDKKSEGRGNRSGIKKCKLLDLSLIRAIIKRFHNGKDVTGLPPLLAFRGDIQLIKVFAFSPKNP